MENRPSGGRSLFLVILVFVVFFAISLLTNIVGPLVPDIIRSFRLNLTLVAVLPFAFFIAYGVMSIPAGMLLERVREKPVMLGAFGWASPGPSFFCLVPRYRRRSSRSFSSPGHGRPQVTINPLLRTAGGEEHFAFNSVLAQLVFGGASFLSPHLYAYFVRNFSLDAAARPLPVRLAALVVPPELPWLSVYWVFAVLVVVMIIVLAATRFPVVIKKEEERAGAWTVHRELFGRKVVLLYFLGIFAYVGTEQGAANWISQFLATYHGYDPQTTGAAAVSGFWGMMTVGCLLALSCSSLWTAAKSSSASRRRPWSSWPSRSSDRAARAVGLPLPRVHRLGHVVHHLLPGAQFRGPPPRTFSGILCTGIIGGRSCRWPSLLGDRIGLRFGLCLLFLTLAYIFSIGLWARPLIANATLSGRRTEDRREA